MNSLVLLSNFTLFLAKNCGITEAPIINSNEISRFYFFLKPLFFNLSFSSLLAKEKELDQIGTNLISMVCFLRASGFLSINAAAEITSSHGSTLTSLFYTLISVNGLSFLSQRRFFRLFKTSKHISPRLRKTLNLTIPGLITVLCIELIAQLFNTFSNTGFILQTTTLLSYFQGISDVQELILYKIISLSTWLLGLHGEHTADGLFRLLQNVPASETKGINLKNFHDVFMNIGGSGSTLTIPFIILFTQQTQHFKSIARLSVPFSLVNVNETLLFGLPVILNPVFFIPFFLAPFINMVICLLAISLGLFDVASTPTIHWMTPPLYSAYIVSNGSMAAIITQLVCILVDGLIYLPFVLLAHQKQQTPLSLAKFFKDDNDDYSFLNEKINLYEERLFVENQENKILGMASAQKVLEQLRGGALLLYFQPKIDAKTSQLVGIEALLRLQQKTGDVLRPTFLPVLYQQGLSKALDNKVIELVFEQLSQWQQLEVHIPTISINFDKDFLLDQQAVQRFIERARKHHVHFYIEITEHTFTVELQALALVIKQLRKSGHKISIDDFGAGYSSLTSLLTLDADEIKLDRQLVVPPEGDLERGHVLLKASIELCHELGFYVVAEGVETQAQLMFLQECNVDTLQGHYLGKPMHPEQIVKLFPKTI